MLNKEIKIPTSKASKIINVMFARLEPKEKQRVLNMIDLFVINHLGVPEKDIPWLNPAKKNIDDYIHVLDLMRLGYAKLINQAEKDFIQNIN